MKIAYLIPYVSQSGPVNVVRYLCEVLKEEHEIDVYQFKNAENISFPVPVQSIDFFEKIDFDRYDVIHSHGVLPDAYIYWHKSEIVRAKTVTTLHNYVKEDYKYAYNPIKAYLLERVWNIVTSRHDRVVTLSKDAVGYYKKFWKNRNITYVHNGIPKHIPNSTASKTLLSDEFIKIGAIGSGDITKRKGFDQVIRVLQKLPNYTLYIAGSGQQIENLRQLSFELGVEQRVNFLGFQENIESFIEAMDIVAIPSRSEGFSLALQEAARQSTPVVCSAIPIFKEIFTEDEVAFFELENTDSLAVAIIKAVEKRHRFSQHIHQKFLNYYTSKTMAENYLKVYREISIRAKT